MIRTLLIMFLLISFAGLSVRAQELAPDGTTFGPANLNELEIESTLRDVSAEIAYHNVTSQTFATLVRLRDAVDDWAARFPKDPYGRRTYQTVCRDFAYLRFVPEAHSAWQECVALYNKRYADVTSY